MEDDAEELIFGDKILSKRLVPENRVNIGGDQPFCRKKHNGPPTLTNFLQQVSAHLHRGLETFGGQRNGGQSEIRYLRGMRVSEFYEWCDDKSYRA